LIQCYFRNDPRIGTAQKHRKRVLGFACFQPS
jgi:hypothetical protein